MHALRSATASAAAAALLALAGCSGEEGGSALPADPPGPSQPPSNTALPQSSASGDAPTAGLDACSLLSANDLAEFGSFGTGTSEEMGGARGCGFDKELDSASDDSLGVTVAIRDEQGVDEVNNLGDGKETGKVPGGRKAVRTSGGTACIIALAVGEQSRIDVGTVAADAEQACEVADKVAGIVEPKLPEG